jgi:leucyl aminopeptidase
MTGSMAVFFDIGGTLGSPNVSPSSRRFLALQVYPYVQGVLETLRKEGARLGIISNTGESDSTDSIRSVLEVAKIYAYFDPSLLLYSSVEGLSKDSPEFFKRAATRAGFSETPQRCLFVGEDSWERSTAVAAGFRVAPHPLLALAVLRGEKLKFIRITIPADQVDKPWANVMKNLSLVPLELSKINEIQVVAIATNAAIATLVNNGFAVSQLPGDPAVSDVYFFHDDLQSRTGFLVNEGQAEKFFADEKTAEWVQFSKEEGLYIALPAGESVEGYHLRSEHGHTIKLIPDMSLLEPFGQAPNTRTAFWLGAPAAEPEITAEEKKILNQRITPESIRYYLDRYTGMTELDGLGKISSRHIQNPDMSRVIPALVNDLEKIGDGNFLLEVHLFHHEGKTLDNVQAELRGESDELVLVTAHLDSTAAFSHRPGSYDPVKHPAPGADDDGSGVAAVLCVAEALRELGTLKKLKRTVRFVLFNAEEHGLIGSKAYARDQAALEAPIVAVFQMDMLGYNKAEPRSFEIHVGNASPNGEEVQARSRVLAERIVQLNNSISPDLGPIQIYADRNDPAAGRSDHASFQERGYSACLVSEDFFIGPGTAEAEPNPNYHKETDTFVDYHFAADIGRSVAAAILFTVNI